MDTKVVLNAIADHLENHVKDDEFCMGVWLGEIFCGNAVTLCKTIGCAIGHSIDLPEVQETGLYLCKGAMEPAFDYPNCDEPVYGIQAISCAFNITYEQAEMLFLPGAYMEGCEANRVAKSDVVRRIRAFAKNLLKPEEFTVCKV